MVDSGEGARGSGSPLLLDQNETRKVRPAPPPPPPPPPPFPRLKVWTTTGTFGVHLYLNKYQCACIGFTVSKGIKYKVCRLLRSSGNRLLMSLNNYNELYMCPRLPGSAISLRARSVPLFLLVLLRKTDANERH